MNTKDILVIKHLLSNKWYIIEKQDFKELRMSPVEISTNIGLYNVVKHQVKLDKNEFHTFNSFILRDETIYVNPTGTKIELAKYSYVRDDQIREAVLDLYFTYLKNRKDKDFGFIKRYDGDRTNIKLLAEDKATHSTAIAEIFCNDLLTAQS